MWQPVDRRRGFTLVELLVVIAIISIISGLVVPGLIDGIDRAHVTQCTNNLREIHRASFLYAEAKGSYPIAVGRDPRAHESLNALLGSRFGEGLEPELFVCPAGEATKAPWQGPPADGAADAGFRLDASTCDYTWTARRTKVSKRCFLSSDRYPEGYEDSDGVHSGHRGFILVLDTTGRVREVDLTDELLTDEKLPPDVVR